MRRVAEQRGGGDLPCAGLLNKVGGGDLPCAGLLNKVGVGTLGFVTHTENRTRVPARSHFDLEFLKRCVYEDDVAAVFTSMFHVGSGCSMSCAGILEHSIDNTIPTWFLAPTDCSKILAQKRYIYREIYVRVDRMESSNVVRLTGEKNILI